MSTNLSRKGFLQLLVGAGVALALPETARSSGKAPTSPQAVVEALETMPLPDPLLHAQSYYGSYTKFPTGVYTEYGVLGLNNDPYTRDRARSFYEGRLRLKVGDALYKHYLAHPEQWVTDTGRVQDLCPFWVSEVYVQSVAHGAGLALHETYQITVARKMMPYYSRFISPDHVGELFISDRPFSSKPGAVVMKTSSYPVDTRYPMERVVGEPDTTLAQYNIIATAEFTHYSSGRHSNLGHILQLSRCDSHNIPVAEQITDSTLAKEWQDFEVGSHVLFPDYTNGLQVIGYALKAEYPGDWTREFYNTYNQLGVPREYWCSDSFGSGRNWTGTMAQLCLQMAYGAGDPRSKKS